jgi:hypothetical protein
MMKTSSLLGRQGDATAGEPEEGSMPGPVSSHTAAEIRRTAPSLGSRPAGGQGILETRPPDPNDATEHPQRVPPIIIQGIMRRWWLIDGGERLGPAAPLIGGGRVPT